MRGRKPAVTVVLSEPVRQTLEGWLRATSTPLGKARRARVLLLLADGVPYLVDQVGRQSHGRLPR